MKTILITGCSSGFGLDTARTFLGRDWKVIATMRTPREDLFPRSEHLRILPLDVTNAESIRKAVAEAGPIDVLVNNAGVGLLNPIEGTPLDTVRAIFESNTFGPIALIQAFLPQFRERKTGVIINVSSTVTLKTLPLLAAYTASKAALNAFSECLALELRPFDIRVNIVLPGMGLETAFGQNAFAQMQKQGVSVPDAYAEMTNQIMSAMRAHKGPTTTSREVAEVIWRVANEPKSAMREPAGADAVALAKSLSELKS